MEAGHGHQWEAEKWVGRCIDVLNWRLPYLTASLASDAGRDTSDFRGIAWKHHLATWMNVRLDRLHELVLDADRYQRALGPPPDWWETDPPNTIGSKRPEGAPAPSEHLGLGWGAAEARLRSGTGPKND